jgi:hypothetical protein
MTRQFRHLVTVVLIDARTPLPSTLEGKWNHKRTMTLLLMAGLDFGQFAIKNDRHCDEARRIAVNITKPPELSGEA